MKIIIFLFSLLLTIESYAQQAVRYEYKKYEKFDFDEIGIVGDPSTPGDISISPRLRKEFRNKLPERKNFNKEMKKAVLGIR